MSRPLRIEYPGTFYHVTSRGNERRMIFQEDRVEKNTRKNPGFRIKSGMTNSKEEIGGSP